MRASDEAGAGRLAELAPHWQAWAYAAERESPHGWTDMVARLAALQDAVAGTVPTAEVTGAVTALLAEAERLLEPFGVPATSQVFGRHLATPTRGQTFSPPVWIDGYQDGEFAARTRFGRFHCGSGGVVHGGAIALVFDDVLGRTSDLAVPERSRTASLTVDYRSLTPLETSLRVQARLVRQEGRKRIVHGELWDGDRLCAEASGLFVELLPHQA